MRIEIRPIIRTPGVKQYQMVDFLFPFPVELEVPNDWFENREEILQGEITGQDLASPVFSLKGARQFLDLISEFSALVREHNADEVSEGWQ